MSYKFKLNLILLLLVFLPVTLFSVIVINAISDPEMYRVLLGSVILFLGFLYLAILNISTFISRDILSLGKPCEEIRDNHLSPPFSSIRRDELGKVQFQINNLVEFVHNKTSQLERLKTALDQSSLVSITDVSGRIMLANERFCEVTEYSLEELLGKDHRILNSGTHSTEFFQQLWKTVVVDQKPWRSQIKNKSKSGKLYWIDASITPLKNTQGQIDEIVSIANIITQQKVGEFELEKRTQMMEEESWLKSNRADLLSIFQKESDFELALQKMLERLMPIVSGVRGAVYVGERSTTSPDPVFFLKARYGMASDETPLSQFKLGDGLIGSVAQSKRERHIEHVPKRYIEVTTGSGRSPVSHLYIIPILHNSESVAVVEIATFSELSSRAKKLTQTLAESLGIIFNSAQEHLLTEALLSESHKLSEMLHSKSKELERQSEQIELASKYKSEFLANMSHELRTPLNSMLILSKALAENKGKNLTSKQIKSAEIIHRGGMELLELINDILDLSKIEAGMLTLNIDAVPPEGIVKDLYERFEPMAEEKGLEFYIKVDKDVPRHIFSDSFRLSQILKNLLSNAIKFTSSGSISFGVNGIMRDNKKWVGFNVTDTGIGIAQDKLGLIFDAFQQVDGSTSRSYTGTGLGLNISRELAGLLGGKISVQSVVGKGSIFTFEVPVGECIKHQKTFLEEVKDDIIIESDSVRHSVEGEYKISLLLVDDDLRSTFALSQVLEDAGMKVEIADSGELALSKLSDTHFNVDIVLMDIMMPGMNGYEAISHIRKIPKYSELPIIALTANVMAEDKEKCLKAGADAYVPKPLDLSELIKHIQQLVQKNAPCDISERFETEYNV